MKEEKPVSFEEIYEKAGELSQEEIDKCILDKRIGFGRSFNKGSIDKIISQALPNQIFSVSESCIYDWCKESAKKLGREDLKFVFETKILKDLRKHLIEIDPKYNNLSIEEIVKLFTQE